MAEYAPPQEFLHVECDCVPDLGPSHCHLCGRLDDDGTITVWPCVYAEAQAAHDEAVRAEAKADGWDERARAKPQYLGPDNGHYEDCMGWSDCNCASYPNPYRARGEEQK